MKAAQFITLLSTRGTALHLPAVFVTDSLNDWHKAESFAHKGLLVSRSVDHHAWDDREIDGLGGITLAGARLGGSQQLSTNVGLCECCNEDLSARLLDSVDELLGMAALPEALSEQIRSDACSIGSTVREMCPAARELELKLEIIGESTCARWHKDNLMGARVALACPSALSSCPSALRRARPHPRAPLRQAAPS